MAIYKLIWHFKTRPKLSQRLSCSSLRLEHAKDRDAFVHVCYNTNVYLNRQLTGFFDNNNWTLDYLHTASTSDWSSNNSDCCRQLHGIGDMVLIETKLYNTTTMIQLKLWRYDTLQRRLKQITCVWSSRLWFHANDNRLQWNTAVSCSWCVTCKLT